jgi:hypothetical protein
MDRRELAVRFQVFAHWICRSCEVEGRDLESEPNCWNCGGEVTVTARPTVLMERGEPES